MKDETKLWFDLANEDHESAVLLWENHRYGLSVFLSQQALEKMLKAYIVEYKNKVPPKTHRIEHLIEAAELDPKDIGSPDVIELSKAYIRVRYPDLNKQYYQTKEHAQPLVDMAGEVFLWIKNKFNVR